MKSAHAHTTDSVLELSPLSGAAYDRQWAVCGDFVRYHPGARHRRRLLQGMLRGISFRSVLDAGCGSGEILLALGNKLESVNPVVGVDLSPEVVEMNRKNLPSWNFEVLDIEQGHLSQTFDLVTCSEVIEHLGDRARALFNLLKMVNPGGHLLITCPAGRMFATEKHWGHVSHPTREELFGYEALGMRVQRYANWGWPNYLFLKHLTNVRPDMAIRSFGSGRYSWPKRCVASILYYLNFFNLRNSSAGCQHVVLYQKDATS